MNVRHAALGLLLLVISGAAAACELPRLVAIPAANSVRQDTPQLFVLMQAYVTGIRAYTACIQAELAAGGGDAAPESLRAQLVARNNFAVAEARSVIASFTDRVAPAEDLYLAAFVDREGESCMQTSRLEATTIINDIAVVFVERGGSSHLNLLADSCPNLERYGQFDVFTAGVGDFTQLGAAPAASKRLCNTGYIKPYLSASSEVTSRPCMLGRFFGLTPEQTSQLMQARAAARPAESDDEGAIAEEETREPRRRER